MVVDSTFELFLSDPSRYPFGSLLSDLTELVRAPSCSDNIHNKISQQLR